MKVSIAEDDAISRTIIKKGLEKFGHECLVAADDPKQAHYRLVRY